MSDRLPVELVLRGHPFDEVAVRHTVRHLALRVGWRLVPSSDHRLVYASAAAAWSPGDEADGRPPPVVIASGPEVAVHLREGRTPFPVAPQRDGSLLPFPRAGAGDVAPGGVAGDVVAGAHACLNLWYEQRTRPAPEDGSITWADDWMPRAGLSEPQALADQWLDGVYEASLRAGWPASKPAARPTIVLTHDVDYLPGARDRGLPRLARAMYRQVVLRQRPADALRVLGRYLGVVGRGEPYMEIPRTVEEERRHGARSSFQLVVAREHRNDPSYAGRGATGTTLPAGWEVGLHGSYLASRRRGRLAAERVRLEALCGRPIAGHRQHYLNFEPGELFREVEAAGLRYDMSVGYNDRSGPRAGTYFPFRPYDLERGRPHGFWEIPFVLMDTTLATIRRLGWRDALAHATAVLRPVLAARGCVSIIWHQEQCGGLLDPGYDRVYVELLDWLSGEGVRLVAGETVIAEMDAAWAAAEQAAA